MSHDPLYEQIVDLLTQVTAIPGRDIRPEATLRVELGMDSVSSLEMLGMLSESFGVDVELEETEHLETVEQVVALVRARLLTRV